MKRERVVAGDSASVSGCAAHGARAGVQPLFLAGGAGPLFCVAYAPADGRIGGAMLHLPAFGEEMNKARRTVALQARALAAGGWLVLVVDPYGTGDSAGDFGDASWSRWLDDASRALAWLRERAGADPWLWGLRTGALLACQAAAGEPGVAGLLLWQPVASGKSFVNQLLRLAGARGAGGASVTLASSAEARKRLAGGESVEIAGYAIAPSLVEGLEAASLATIAPKLPVVWIESSSQSPAELAPASRQVVGRWREHGAEVAVEAVEGPSFWATQEIAEGSAIVERTLSLLRAAGPR